MGFKRTTEGRVFFKNIPNFDEEENSPASSQTMAKPLTAPMQKPTQAPQQPQQSNTQLQIVGLLKALNEKLQSSQKERIKMSEEIKAYRSVIQDLENKTQRTEDAYIQLKQNLALAENKGHARILKAQQLAQDAQKEVEETRKLISNLSDNNSKAQKNLDVLNVKLDKHSQLGQSLYQAQKKLEERQRELAEVAKNEAFEEKSKALVERIEKVEEGHKSLTNRIEESISQQEKLMRKIDKAIEDRARFMRKMERIEETVLQTRDALNSKALVVLSDQEAKARLPASDDSGPDIKETGFFAKPSAVEQELSNDKAPWWRKSTSMNATGFSFLLILGLSAGWFISDMQNPQLPSLKFIDTSKFTAEETASLSEAQSPSQNTEISQGAAIIAEEQSFEDVFGQGEIDNIDLMTIENEQEIAEQLNALEPSNLPTPAKPKSEVAAIKDKPAETPAAADPLPEKELAKPVSKAPQPAPAFQGKTDNLDQADLKPDPNLPQIIKQIEAQAYKGVPEAQHDLAAIYTAGHGNVQQDYKRAAYWFQKAAGQGVSNAAYNLGVLHHQGLGLKSDIKEAIKWYIRAAELDHPEAQYNLGIAYIESIGVPYDPDIAAEYFENAATQGIMEAAYNLGLIYENGLLGKVQPDLALMWYKQAADKGSPEAKAALQQLAETLNINLREVNKLAENMHAVHMKKKQTSRPASSETQNQAPAATNAQNSLPEKEVSKEESQHLKLVMEIQKYLMAQGLYPGPADGISGILTSDAIRAYQAVNNMDIDGNVSPALLEHMKKNPKASATQ